MPDATIASPPQEPTADAKMLWSPTARRCKVTSKGSGEPCKNAARNGFEVCHYHGAGMRTREEMGERRAVRGSIRVSAYADTLPKALGDRLREFAEDPNVHKLEGEIAVLRAHLVGVLGREIGPQYTEQQRVADSTRLADRIGALAAKHAKMGDGYRLTVTSGTIDAYVRKCIRAVEDCFGSRGARRWLERLRELQAEENAPALPAPGETTHGVKVEQLVDDEDERVEVAAVPPAPVVVGGLAEDDV